MEKLLKVRKAVNESGRMTIQELKQTIGIPLGSIWTILHDWLNMNKVFLKWVPKFLAYDLKQNYKVATIDFLENFSMDHDQLLHRM